MNNFWSNNYIEFKINGDRNKTLWVEEYLKKIKLYLKKSIIKDLKKSDKWKIHLKIATNFISSKDFDKEHVAYFKREK